MAWFKDTTHFWGHFPSFLDCVLLDVLHELPAVSYSISVIPVSHQVEDSSVEFHWKRWLYSKLNISLHLHSRLASKCFARNFVKFPCSLWYQNKGCYLTRRCVLLGKKTLGVMRQPRKYTYSWLFIWHGCIVELTLCTEHFLAVIMLSPPVWGCRPCFWLHWQDGN